MRLEKVPGGEIQVSVRMSAEQFRILEAYTTVKGLRTVQDGLRKMIMGAESFLEQLKKQAAAPAATAPAVTQVAPAAQISPEPKKPARTPEPQPVHQDAPTSDDGMVHPPVRIGPAAALDDDGEELSTNAKISKNRAQPARMSEDGRWTSLASEP